MAKQLNVDLRFTADNGQAKKQIQELQSSLEKLMTSANKNTSGLGITKDIAQATNEVAKLQAMLESSKNSSGGLDLGKFNQSLSKGKMQISDYAKVLSSLGPQGEQAFAKMAKAIINAEVPLKRTNSVLKEFKTSLANTARWQLSSSMLHGFMGAVQSAYGYAQDLNESLNNIRIVTGQNIEQMSRFAAEANKAAQALSTTTTDYTNASLIFYQQGLSDAEVAKRTEVTVKMANAAGQSAQVISDQLTAVWNNFYDGSKSLEYYADVMTALGAATASSTDEIAGGLEKFAAIGQTIGLSYEYAASALATITSNTRQSEEVVGTALKTIFARIQGLNLGETLDDGTSLNKYSAALESVGISIFEQSGEIKKMDSILDEMAAKWSTLAKDQQIALAQTVAGVRQYTQLVALMDNWNAGDSDSMVANLNTSYNASGTLTEQADIYAESWEAAQKRVTAAAEEIYNELLNDKFFIELNNGFAGFLNVISDTIGALGGLPGVLSVASTIMFKMFGKDMAKTIDDWAYNVRLRSQDGVDAIIESRQKAKKALEETFTDSVDTGPSSAATKASFESSAVVADALLKKREELLAKGRALSEEDELQIKYLQQANDALGEQAAEVGRVLEKTQQETKELESQARLKINRGSGKSDAEKKELKETLNQIRENQQAYAALEQVANKIDDNFTVDNIISELEFLSEATSAAGGNTEHLQALITKLGKEGTSVDDAIKAIADEVERLGNEAYEAMDGTEGIRGSLKELGMTDDAIEKLINSWTKQGIITADLAQKLRGVKVQGDAAAEAIAKMKSPPPSMGQAFVTIAQSIGNVASAINTLKGLIDTWNNDDMSFGDKLLSTFTSLGMVIPMLINGYKTLSTARLKDTLINELNAASERRLAKAKRDTAKSSDKAEKEQRKETAAQQQNMLTDAAQSRGKKGGKYLKPKGGKYLKPKDAKFMDQTTTSMKSSDGAALTKGGAAIGTSLLAIAAAIAIVVGTVAWAVHQSKAAERELEKAKQAASELKQNYETVKAAQEEFNNTASSYESARDALDNLTQGTEEYTQAVQAANEQAMALLAINKDLAYTIEGGQIKIDETSLENAKKAQQQQLEYAQAAQIAGQQQAKQAEENLKKRDMARQLNTNADDGLALGNTAAAGLAGAAAGALIGSAIPVIGTAIGAAVGGAIGLIGGFISDAVGGTAVEAETDALEKLEKAYAEDNTILQKLADGSLTDQEWDAIGIEDENLRASLQANSDEVSALVKEMAANTAAVSAQNDLVAANALADNEAVQKSDYQDQIIDIAGDAYGVAYEKAMESDWIDTWGKNDINKATGVNQAAKDVFAEYLKYAGLEGQGYTLTDTTGTDKNRKFVYEDAEGNEHTVSLEAMQAARAAYEASNVLNDSATKLVATFDKLANSGNSADQALLSFVSGKNFEGATKSEFEAMQGTVGEVAYDEATGRYDTAGIQAYVEDALGETLTDEVAVRYGYKTADAMLQAYAEKLANTDKAWDSIKIPDNFKFADDLSLSAAKALETQISKINLGPAGEAAGKQYVDKLNEMLGELDPEDQQAALEALTKIDWSDWDAMDQAKQIMSDLGVEIDFGSEAWQKFAQEMRIAGGAIPDFSGLKQDLIDITSILGKLDFGSTISEEDYQILMASEYSKDWEQFFILQADGTRKFIGNSQEMLQATRDQINAEREALAERKKIQEEFNKVKWQYTDADGNKVDVDWAKAAEDGIQDGDIATARNLMNSNGATQSVLKALDYDDATLQKIIEAAEAGDENARAQIAEMFNRLQAFRDEDLELVDVDLNEMMASTATNIHELNAMLEEGEISTEAWAKQAVVLEEAAAKNANTLAELDQVVADFGLNKLDESYTQNLLRIAEGYESCAEELANYQAALTAFTLDDSNAELKEQLALAEDNLRAMIRLEEGAKQYGLEVEVLTAQSKRMAKAYGLSAEEAANLAIQNQRMNKGVSALVDNWKDWKKQLSASNKLTEDYAEAIVDCTAAIADLVGASEDLELPDEFFNAENMALIEKAIKGDVDAINKLGAAVAYTTVEALEFNEAFATLIGEMETFRDEPIDLSLINEEKFLEDQQLVLQGIEDIKNGVIAAGGAMDAEWVAALNRMALTTGMSVEQMNGLLGSLGVQAKVETTYVPQKMQVPTYTEVVEPIPVSAQDSYFNGTSTQTVNTTRHMWRKYTIPGPPMEVNGYAAVAQISTVDNPLTPQITTSGAPAATYSGNRGSVAPSATKGSNKGGGGGSKKQTKETKTAKDEIDRYHTVKEQLEELSKQLDKVSKAKDRAFGKAKLDLINQEIELLDKEIEKQELYLSQIESNARTDKALMVVYGAEFDENGVITNYEALMQQELEKYNSAVIAYNNDNNEATFAAAEARYEKFKEDLAQYEETMDLWFDEEEKRAELLREQYDKQLEALTYKVELEISLEDDELKMIEYYLELIEDDSFAAAEAIALLGEKTQNTLDKIKIYSEGISELLDLHGMDQDDLDQIMAGNITNEELAEKGFTENDISTLRSYIDELINANLELKELRDTMQEKVLDAFDAFMEKIDKSVEKIEYLNNVIENYKNIIDLVGAKTLGLNDEFMKNLSQAAVSTATDLVESNRIKYESALEAQKKAQAEYEAAVARGDEESIKMWEETLQEINSEIQESHENMLSSWESALQMAADAFDQAVERTIANFEKAISGTYGSLESLMTAFERHSEINERYVEDYKKIYELSKLNRDITNSIDETDSIKAKQELKKLQEEINKLQESDTQMSQYDLDYLQKKYDLKLAEIALEDAQNAKTQVRLRRDTEGNFSYVYTGDQATIDNAQQNYEDKLYEMQEFNDEYLKTVQENILNSEIELADALAELDRSKFATDEEYYAEVNRITEYYVEQHKFWIDEANKALKNNKNTYEEDWNNYSKITGYKISKNEDYVDSFDETIYAQLTGYESLEEAQFSFVEATNIMIEELDAAFEEWLSNYDAIMSAAGTSSENFANDTTQAFETIKEESSEAVEQASEDADDISDAFGEICDAVSAWQEEYSDAIGSAMDSNENMIDSCTSLISQLSNVNGSLANTGRNFTNTASEIAAAAASIEASAARAAAAAANVSSSGGSIPSGSSPISGTGTKQPTMHASGTYTGNVTTGVGSTYKTVNGVYYVKVGSHWIKNSDLNTYATFKGGNSSGGTYAAKNIPTYAYYDTGGYTGEWGSSGKLAVLHEKELVLNKNDTENLLTSVEILRNIMNTLDLQTSYNQLSGILTAPIFNSPDNDILEQIVQIQAEFPNVTNRSEIEEAFDTLINRASQYANRKK